MNETGMNKFGKVAVLFGGTSGERGVSIKSGSAVLAALLRQGVNAHAFDPANQALSELKGFDAVMISLHGRGGEDGTMQGALELMGIPYTGSGVMASSLAMDKWRTKMIWLANGIPTPRYRILTGKEDSSEVVRDLGVPLIVKPANEGSTLGLTRVTEAAQLPAGSDVLVMTHSHALDQQLCEVLHLHNKISRAEAMRRAEKLLEEVQIEGAEVLPEIEQSLEQVDITIGEINLAPVSLEPTPSKVPAISEKMGETAHAATRCSIASTRPQASAVSVSIRSPDMTMYFVRDGPISALSASNGSPSPSVRQGRRIR